MLIHYDCRHFQGSIPCSFHKAEGVHCQDCPHYDQVTGRILTCAYYCASAHDQERMLDLPMAERFEAVS